MGVECIPGETNLRSAFRLHWEDHYYGSALAATGLALAGGFGHVCIPSGYSHQRPVVHGSTMLVDERYSTERLRVVHDGAEATRAEKVARIVAWNPELVLARLRVCTNNRGGAYNCGTCKKCVRTAIPLHVLGVLDRAEAFPDKRTDHWERVSDTDHLDFVEENLALAREHGDRRTAAMLERVVARRRRRAAVRALVDTTPAVHLAPLLRRLQGRRD